MTEREIHYNVAITLTVYEMLLLRLGLKRRTVYPTTYAEIAR